MHIASGEKLEHELDEKVELPARKARPNRWIRWSIPLRRKSCDEPPKPSLLQPPLQPSQLISLISGALAAKRSLGKIHSPRWPSRNR
jgi:hypothetical protein